MKTRIRALLRRRDGFTLVETVTATALLVVLVGICTTLVLSSMSSAARGATVMEQQSLGDALYDYVSDCLRYGEDLSLTDGGGSNMVSVDEGLLLRRVNGGELTEVYPADLYAGCLASMTVTGDGETASLTITLSLDGETRYTRTGAVRLLNSTLSGSGYWFTFS